MSEFRLLNERARSTLSSASDEAKALGRNHIGAEHILLALLKDGSSAAGMLLAEYGINYEPMYTKLKELLQTGKLGSQARARIKCGYMNQCTSFPEKCGWCKHNEVRDYFAKRE